MKPAILITVISSFVATTIGRSIYISGPSLDLQPRSTAFLETSLFDRHIISPSAPGVVPYRIPLRISATPRYIQRPIGLAPQSTFNALQRPPFYPHDHHAFPSRRRLDHSHSHDFFGSGRRHRHTLHSERKDRMESSRRRRRLRRLIQRHREAEEKAALRG
ncbi:hypothetical protein LOTGIDRAFT_228385 [Lottia gigantea]|uniref:Uncharacterized protein n=1 Tax=Lottia gigantea TaxID=225164 RepID=V4AWH0_LOTGI|nr:hypothetical protein LOTGIDRAFT_228385 [Lottia gigantea]ESO97841.1 hypothetical protein LOTGIDRAFT_228385 [Lottia gigantea]